jgi:hypothetical protein
MKYSALLIALCLCGCSHIKPIGKIGGVKYYKVQATSLLGPSQTMIVTEQGEEVKNGQAYAGNGLAPAVVGSGGIVGGAVLFGKSLRPDRTVVNQDTSADTDVDVDLDNVVKAGAVAGSTSNSSSSGKAMKPKSQKKKSPKKGKKY